ncbi:hypothetical protein [Thalassovita sp.]|uniref:hypothetical protein n=1 Tax=Thalassovita sp. TaxID=1979401 RepID=UPI0029DE87CF|nr:hypothetical protein [Thalassovita sp.]
MTLSTLIMLVSGGIVSVAILLHLIGLGKPPTFADEDAVRQVWAAEYPDTQVQKIWLSRRQEAALVRCNAGMGVVWPNGMDGAARLLLGVEIQDMENGLMLSLPDYRAPEIRLSLDPDEINSWRKEMEGRV